MLIKKESMLEKIIINIAIIIAIILFDMVYCGLRSILDYFLMIFILELMIMFVTHAAPLPG